MKAEARFRQLPPAKNDAQRYRYERYERHCRSVLAGMRGITVWAELGAETQRAVC